MRRLVTGMAAILVVAGVGLLCWYLRGETSEVRTADLWRQAQQEVANGHFHAAIKHFEQCLDRCPLHAETQFLLARTCRRAKDLAGWQSHLAHAEVLQWPRAQIDLERRLERAQSGDLGNVTKLETMLETPSGEDVVIFEALAKGYLENDWVDRALDVAHLWVERYPDDWEAKFYRGLAFQRKPKPDEAIADLQQALEINPRRPELQLALADVYLANDKFEEALPLYERYLETDAANATVLLRIANCEYSLAYPDRARLTLARLFFMDPDNVMALFLQAKLELADGMPDKALGWLRQAERLAPHEPNILENLMVVLQQLNRDEESEKYHKQVNELRRLASKLERAVYQSRMQPDNPSHRYQAAMLNLQLGREDEAALWFQRVLWIDPNHRPTHEALADYFDKHNDPQRAAYHRNKAGSSSRKPKPDTRMFP